MMNISSEQASSPSRMVASSVHNQALELEKQLRSLIQTKGHFDPSVRAIRNSIREKYEFIILNDQEFSESHDVEQALWQLHYKRIEEFRVRIRKSTAAASVPIPNGAAVGSKLTQRREPLQKILTVFKSFLSETSGFYNDLILKLKSKYGLSQDYFYEGAEFDSVVQDKKRALQLKRCQKSCHRCLIFLGDLARYKESHGETGENRVHDWSVPAGYYLKAASLWPSSGNPHNQLAVLATYVGDDLLAVYRYFRSLAVESPFLTARDNLMLLFEKNRQHYAQLPIQANDGAISKTEPQKTHGKGRLSKGDKKIAVDEGLVVKSVDNVLERRKSFYVRFVRLNGILFTRTSLETFSEVYSATLHELEQFLSVDETVLEAMLSSDSSTGLPAINRAAAGALQLISILIFTVHNVNWGLDAHQPTYADILQRSALFKYAFTAAFEFAACFMTSCLKSKDISASPLFPSILVFIEWLACRPELALGNEADEQQLAARTSFWKHCLILLNRLCESECGSTYSSSCLENANMSSGSADDEAGVALWEDHELRGFLPLVPSQVAFDYSRRLSRTKDTQIRIKRFLAAGKAVAHVFEGTEKGIVYDEELKTFYLFGDDRKKPGDGKSLPSSLAEVNGNKDEFDVVEPREETRFSASDKSEELPVNELVLTSEDNSCIDLTGNSHVELSGLEEEDEEEELIVFKPLSRERQVTYSETQPQVNASVGISNASGVHLENASVSTLLEKLAVPSQVLSADAKTCLPLSSVPLPKTYPPPTASYSFTMPVPSSPTFKSYASDHKGDISMGLGQFVNNREGSNYSGNLTHSGADPPGFLSTTYKDIDRSAFGAGVIGQPKPISSWFKEPSMAAMSKTLPISNSVEWPLVGTSMSLGSTVLQKPFEVSSLANLITTSMPLSTSMPIGPPPAPFYSSANDNLNLLSKLQNLGLRGPSNDLPVTNVKPSDVEIKPDVAMTSSPRQSHVPASAVGGNMNRVSVAAIRPPPGFGPIPMKSVASKVDVPVASTNASLDSQSESNPQADDYRWLDNYMPGKPSASQSLYSSDYGIWSNNSSMVPTSKSPSYPFPGMGAARTTAPFQDSQLWQQQQQQHHQWPAPQQVLQYQVHENGKVNHLVEQNLSVETQQFQLEQLQQQQFQQQQQQLLLQQQQQKLLYKQFYQDPFVS